MPQGEPLHTSELALGFIKHAKVDMTVHSWREVRIRVARQLKGLVDDGVALRVHSGDTGVDEEGRWLLNEAGFGRMA